MTKVKAILGGWRAWTCVLLLFLMSGHVVRADQASARSDHVEVEFMAEVASVQPGTPFWVGLRMTHEPHWHTYWSNPADSGLETLLQWDLPDGFEAGPVHWPYPERMVVGPLVSYGFEREVVLMVELTPPADLDTEEPVVLNLRVDWLECREICVPGGADLTLALPVAVESPVGDERWADLFEQARAEWPVRDSDWSFEAEATAVGYRLTVRPPAGFAGVVDDARLFIMDPELVQYGPDQNWRPDGDGYVLDLARDQTFGREADVLRGVLVAESGWGADQGRALYVEAAVREGAAQAASEGPGPEASMALMLLLAFLGGVLLNLMPCVFPVISMKIMGFVQQAEQEHSQIFKHGLWFGLGILASFWVLAGLLIALRAGGEQLGWGFHLQSPAFLLGMSVLFFLLALNLFGVFEVGTSWMGFGQKAASSRGWTGSFFSGALASLIATPCTAPFMGAALGYALTLSPAQALLIFTMLGVGMALPYVLLSAFPGWLSHIPKPGAWMESFKQAMGWLFVLFVVYMAHVLFAMGGGAAVVLLLNVACLVGIAAWVLGRWGALSRGPRVRRTARIVAVLLMLGGTGAGLLVAGQLGPVDAEGGADASGIPWESFSPERFAELRAAGTPVFVNFTAAWCTQCKLNDLVAFSSSRVQAAFADRGVVALKADWTHRDAEIGDALEGYGRNSVPFYVLYGEGADAERQVLPEILRPGTVLEALERM